MNRAHIATLITLFGLLGAMAGCHGSSSSETRRLEQQNAELCALITRLEQQRYATEREAASLSRQNEELRATMSDLSATTMAYKDRVAEIMERLDLSKSMARAMAMPEERRFTYWTCLCPAKHAEGEPEPCREPSGYGLYSYLLLPHPPSDAERGRYLAVVKAAMQMTLNVAGSRLKPSEMNLLGVPVFKTPREEEAEAFLEVYDYAYAQLLLIRIGRAVNNGPVIVSTANRLSGLTEPPEQFLWQDLSAVSPSLANLWVQKFVAQAATAEFWKNDKAEEVVLSIRELLEEAGNHEAEIKSQVSQWILFITNRGDKKPNP